METTIKHLDALKIVELKMVGSKPDSVSIHCASFLNGSLSTYYIYSGESIGMACSTTAYTIKGEKVLVKSVQIYHSDPNPTIQIYYIDSKNIEHLLHTYLNSGEFLYKKDPRPYLTTAGKVLYGNV